MRVVRNFGSHWGILASNDEGGEQSGDQPEPQQRPQRRNVRGQGERGQSYGLIVPGITRSLTCMERNELTMGYLKTMRVVRNFGSHWGILASDDEGGEQSGDQPEPQQRPQRRNVRGQGERG
ncbi:unnamed protein product [Lactuca saligna]|uniref:Uncharacterized protein n=1 Tax=Lactuca saligna TaxID=75948 RepID=A0AA35Y3J7_LACSI|nr:unnamed protein product [Lactuca saligna]